MSLDLIPIGNIRGNFFVPSYQRGYRWDTDDVQRLLDDIWKSNGKPYSLQPVVIKRRNNTEIPQEQEWELIDGQQRLTTLYLIFLYVQKKGWKKNSAPYAIKYETRPGSAEYLKEISAAEHDKNIDYFHLYKAYECIGRWFENHGDEYIQENVVNKFHSYLYDNVCVIWYIAPDHPDDNQEDSTALFTRLNIGRIPLTDAELVKALLLSTVPDQNLVRAAEIAAQWDSIERDLQNPDIWAFVVGANSHHHPEKYQTRISLLLDTLADSHKPISTQIKRPRYYTFDALFEKIKGADTRLTFWNSVIELHALILGWFANPAIFNKIGFLVANNVPFGQLVRLANDKKKTDFISEITGNIRNIIDISKSDLMDLKYYKNNDYHKLFKLLLIMNIETISRSGQRFPFHRHMDNSWSLEHIHAQNAEGLTKVDQWKAWLVAHKNALQSLPVPNIALVQEIEGALATMDTAKNFGVVFSDLSSKVINIFNGSDELSLEDDLHSITNLALLSSGDNSALSNSVFEVKRQVILEIDRNLDGTHDGYIPVCTRNVFLKYYTSANAQQIHFWSPQDKSSYFYSIVFIINDYLKPESK